MRTSRAACAAALIALATGVTACGTRPAAEPAAPASAAVVTVPPAASAAASPRAAGPASQQPPAPAPTLTAPVTLTTAENGASVRLHAGQRMAVVLEPDGIFSWHVPVAAGAAVRRVSSSGGYPGRQAARATFTAAQPGSATLTAIDDTACLHARPACEPPQREWRVTVIVTGAN